MVGKNSGGIIIMHIILLKFIDLILASSEDGCIKSIRYATPKKSAKLGIKLRSGRKNCGTFCGSRILGEKFWEGRPPDETMYTFLYLTILLV